MEFSRKQSSSYKDKIIKEIEALPDERIFTEFDDEIIRKYYPTKKTADIAKILNKNHVQVKTRATKLGVRKEK